MRNHDPTTSKMNKTVAGVVFVIMVFIFSSHLKTKCLSQDNRQNHQNKKKDFDEFVIPHHGMSRKKIQFNLCYVSDVDMFIQYPSTEDVYHEEIYFVYADGEVVESKKLSGGGDPIFSKEKKVKKGKPVCIKRNPNQIFRIPEDWKKLKIRPMGPSKNKHVPAGFSTQLIIHDSRVSNSNVNWRSEQKPRLDVWIYVSPYPEFGRKKLFVSIRYDYVAEEGHVKLNLPSKKNKYLFRGFALYADDKKLTYKHKQPPNNSHLREVTIEAGGSKKRTFDLSNMFTIPEGWEQLKVVPKGKTISKGAEKIPLGFKGSALIKDEPPKTK